MNEPLGSRGEEYQRPDPNMDRTAAYREYVNADNKLTNDDLRDLDRVCQRINDLLSTNERLLKDFTSVDFQKAKYEAEKVKYK